MPKMIFSREADNVWCRFLGQNPGFMNGGDLQSSSVGEVPPLLQGVAFLRGVPQWIGVGPRGW